MRALLTAIAILAPALAGCVADDGATGADVVATFYPLAFVAERVAGDRLVVSSLVPDGVEPHEWEPTAETVATVGGAKVVLRNGAGLDPWVDRVVSESGTRAEVVDASGGLALLDREDEHDEEDHGATDPHYWLDPVLMQDVVRTVESALARADPDGAATFRANADNLSGELAALDRQMANAFASCEKREILATHLAFSYPAKRYDFTQHGIAGASPDEEPSPARIQEVVEFAKSRGIYIVYHERLVSPRLALAVASELPNGTTLPLDPIEGIPAREQAKGADYFTLQRQNVANLRVGMVCA